MAWILTSIRMDFPHKIRMMISHVGHEFEARTAELSELDTPRRLPKPGDANAFDLSLQIGALFRTMEQLTELKNQYDEKLKEGRQI